MSNVDRYTYNNGTAKIVIRFNYGAQTFHVCAFGPNLAGFEQFNVSYDAPAEALINAVEGVREYARVLMADGCEAVVRAKQFGDAVYVERLLDTIQTLGEIASGAEQLAADLQDEIDASEYEDLAACQLINWYVLEW